jgi:hypothetical protein
MKVICKTNISYQGIIYDLTIGGEYEVYHFNNGVGGWLYVIDDSGAKEHYRESMYITLAELRDIRIEEILK